MEDVHFTETDKSKTSVVQCEKDAHFFFDVQGIVHREFVPPGQTVNQEFYLEVLRRMRENVRKKTPRIVEIGWMVSPLGQRPSLHSFVCDPVFGLSGIPHPPYSPDPAPSDFFLFLTMKKKLKGKRFATVEEVKTASQEAFNNINLQQFQRCFTHWEKRLDKCIASNGEYFEGN